jgi:hypothetical protein
MTVATLIDEVLLFPSNAPQPFFWHVDYPPGTPDVPPPLYFWTQAKAVNYVQGSDAFVQGTLAGVHCQLVDGNRRYTYEYHVTIPPEYFYAVYVNIQVVIFN